MSASITSRTAAPPSILPMLCISMLLKCGLRIKGFGASHAGVAPMSVANMLGLLSFVANFLLQVLQTFISLVEARYYVEDYRT